MTNAIYLQQAPERGRFSRGAVLRSSAPAVLLVALLLVILVNQPAFFAGSGLTVLATQSIPILLLALGHMMVMMVGAIDLASASLAVFSAILVAKTLPDIGVAAPLLTILVGAAAGALVGFLAAHFQVPSFAVTLGALGVWQALALRLSDSTTVYVDRNQSMIAWLVDYGILGVPLSVVCSLGLAVALWAVINWTVVGRNVRAVGLNEKASIMSGVSSVATKTIVFAISGGCAALAGIVLTAQQGTATASGVGVGLLLPGIAAAVAGGVAITGGVGNPLNVIVGALVITLIPIGSAVIGIDPKLQQIVYGALIILAVVVTMDRAGQKIVK